VALVKADLTPSEIFSVVEADLKRGNSQKREGGGEAVRFFPLWDSLSVSRLLLEHVDPLIDNISTLRRSSGVGGSGTAADREK
jgi:hypothetical protein